MDWPGRLKTVREVDIETRRSGDAPAHLTTIWVAVEDGEVYARSWHGAGARWYREVIANPEAVLHFDRVSLPVRATPAVDPESVERASAGLRRKYSYSTIVDSMVRDEILDTTLRLEANGPPGVRDRRRAGR